MNLIQSIFNINTKQFYLLKRLSEKEKLSFDIVQVRYDFWMALLAEQVPQELEDKYHKNVKHYSSYIRIHLDPIAIIHVVEKFMQGKIDSEYMVKWAHFVLEMDCYVPLNYFYICKHPEKANKDKYKCLFDILEAIAGSKSSGDLTINKSESYINFIDDFLKKTPM